MVNLNKSKALRYLTKFQRMSKEEQLEEIRRLEVDETSKIIIKQ